jgi:hypothetical protein
MARFPNYKNAKTCDESDTDLRDDYDQEGRDDSSNQFEKVQSMTTSSRWDGSVSY